MMRFTVIWMPGAQDEMAEIWLRSRSRQLIADAVNRIDLLLAADPYGCGEEFYGDFLLVVPPMHVVYVVKPDDCLVEVLKAWSV